MKEEKIHNHIEEQKTEEKEALFSRLSSEIEFTPSKPVKTNVNPKVLALAVPAAVLICLCIIIVPIIILNSNKEPDIRYYTLDYCVYQPLDCSLKEYGQKNNVNLLYIDWYDLSDCTTQLYVDKNDQSRVVYFEEILLNFEKEIVATLYITDIYTKMDFLDEFCEGCNESTTLNKLTVNYHNAIPRESYAYFQYNKYSYYISLQSMSESLNDEQLIINIVESMLQL